MPKQIRKAKRLSLITAYFNWRQNQFVIEEVSTHQPEVEVEDARDMRMRNVTLKGLTSGFLMEYDPRRGEKM